MNEPIAPRYKALMNTLAKILDEAFNGSAKGNKRSAGFVLLVWPWHEKDGRCNYISNGADRRGMIPFLRETAARFEKDAAAEDGKKLSAHDLHNRLNTMACESAALLASTPITDPSYPFLTAAVERLMQAHTASTADPK